MTIFLRILVFSAVVFISLYLFDNENTGFILQQTPPVKLIAVFLSGLFYTSFLTVALSVITLISIGSTMNPYMVAVVAGLGAVIGDLFIIKVFRTFFSAFSSIRHQNNFKAFKRTLGRYHLDIVSLILGSLIVASPLPDELGLILLGVSKLSYIKLAALTFFLNSIGILLILLAIRAIQ